MCSSPMACFPVVFVFLILCSLVDAAPSVPTSDIQTTETAFSSSTPVIRSASENENDEFFQGSEGGQSEVFYLKVVTPLRNVKVALTAVPGEYGTECQAVDILATGTVGRTLRIDPGTILTEVITNLPRNTHDLYLCIEVVSNKDVRWFHLGELKRDRFPESPLPRVMGIRGEGDKVYETADGDTIIQAHHPTTLTLFGTGFTHKTSVMLTTTPKKLGSTCDNIDSLGTYPVTSVEYVSSYVIQIQVDLPQLDRNREYYLCVGDGSSPEENWIHQGPAPWVTIQAHGRLIPLWLQCILLGILLILSGLFSGLNLGLMSLDTTELQVIVRCGSPTEKKYARSILPLRKRGNYLLCTLLLGNVLVNSTLTILLDDLTSGLVAVIGATVGIVIFGEILPQAVCSRHGLAVGARTSVITMLFMVLTFPLSFPISKLLDWVLGEEMTPVYDREKLTEYIRLTQAQSHLEAEEVNIISGALEMKKKTAGEIMTRLEDVFMLPYNAVLDLQTLSEIVKAGFTRIPVYSQERCNIVALLNAKDLAFVDPDDRLPLRTVCEYYRRRVIFVSFDVTLDILLNEFKKGQSHVVFVGGMGMSRNGDYSYRPVGLVTLEDVIEEIIQSEIFDETDTNSLEQSPDPFPDKVGLPTTISGTLESDTCRKKQDSLSRSHSLPTRRSLALVDLRWQLREYHGSSTAPSTLGNVTLSLDTNTAAINSTGQADANDVANGLNVWSLAHPQNVGKATANGDVIHNSSVMQLTHI